MALMLLVGSVIKMDLEGAFTEEVKEESWGCGVAEDAPELELYNISIVVDRMRNSGHPAIVKRAELIKEGEALFEANCKQCHAIHAQVVGPALLGVTERQSVPWLVRFIKNPEKVIKSGDPYAIDLYNKYKQFMPDHDFLADDQIRGIIDYISIADGDTSKLPGYNTGFIQNPVRK